MKLNLKSIDSKLNGVANEFVDNFMRIADETLNKRLGETLQIAFAISLGLLANSVFVHVCLPEVGTWWSDLCYKLGGVAALALTLFFIVYVAIKAGQALEFSEEFVPIEVLKSLELPAESLNAAPYNVVYQLPSESYDAFSQRALEALSTMTHVIVVGFRDPLIVVKAGGESVTACRGEYPFENGHTGDCFEERYSDYTRYIHEFVDGFRKHMRTCIASSSEFTLEDLYKSKLPGRIPSNFGHRKTHTMSIIFLLLVMSINSFGQSLSEVLGRRASDVPAKGQSVSYIADNGRTVTYIADGVRNYVQLFNDNQGGLSRKVRNFQMVIAGDDVVAKSSAIGHTQQPVRVGAAAEQEQPATQIPPRPGVNVRPDAGIGVKVDPVATTQAIEEFKEESKSLFGDVWAVVRAVLRAFGQFILFLMVLLRMFASQAANEMVSTYLGRIWGGSFILSALMTLSAFQMLMAWLAGGYLLCEWAIYLTAANLSTLLWFVLLVAGSIVIIKLSKWFVISPRDVVDGSKAVAGGGRGMMVRD